MIWIRTPGVEFSMEIFWIKKVTEVLRQIFVDRTSEYTNTHDAGRKLRRNAPNILLAVVLLASGGYCDATCG